MMCIIIGLSKCMWQNIKRSIDSQTDLDIFGLV